MRRSLIKPSPNIAGKPRPSEKPAAAIFSMTSFQPLAQALVATGDVRRAKEVVALARKALEAWRSAAFSILS
jgi:hypothetical protein